MSLEYKIVIPARYASTRLPGKPLLEINSKPLIQHVYEQACASNASMVCIATDDERIASAANDFNANIVMTSNEHESGTDRLAEVVKIQNFHPDDIIVNIQGDEFGLSNLLVDQVAKCLHEHDEAVVATLCEPIDNIDDYQNPNVVKVVQDCNGYALYFSRASIPANRAGGLPENCYRHIGLYAYRAGYLEKFTQTPISGLEKMESLEQLRVLESGGKIAIDVACTTTGIGIDTEEDLAKARELASG